MEVFVQLEAKILHLVTLVKNLKDENQLLKEQCSSLNDKNLSLHAQIEAMENTLLAGDETASELSHERELTKMIVLDLMKSLDSVELNDQLPVIVASAEAPLNEHER